MNKRINTAVLALVLSLPIFNSCAQNGSVSDTDKGTLPALYNQSGESVINSNQKYYTADDSKNCIYLTDGAELILSDSEIVSGGNSEDGDASAIRTENESRAVLDNCKVSAFGTGARALFASGAELITSGGSAFTNGNGASAAYAENGSTLDFDGITLNSYGESSDTIEASESSMKITGSVIGASGAYSSAFNQTGGVSELSGCELTAEKSSAVIIDSAKVTMSKMKIKSLYYPAFRIKSGTVEFSGEAEYGKAFAELSGDFSLTLADVKPKTDDKDFLRISKAPHGKVFINGTKLSGNITADKESYTELSLSESEYSGAINPENANCTVVVTMDEKSAWSVTAPSYIAAIITDDLTFPNIASNGFDVFYNPDDEKSAALDGKTYLLTGGGELKPV